jgi:hypothetical protein
LKSKHKYDSKSKAEIVTCSPEADGKGPSTLPTTVASLLKSVCMAGIGCDVVGDYRAHIAGVIAPCDLKAVGIKPDELVVVSIQAAVDITVCDVDGARRADREGIRHRVVKGRVCTRDVVEGNVEGPGGGKDVSNRRTL